MSMYRIKGASGPVINQVFHLGERTVIGSDVGCDIRLDEPGVAGRHAAILLDEEHGITVRNLDSGHETLRNGEAVTESALAPGDELRVGSCRWLLQAPGLRPDRVLTADAVAPVRRHWPWMLPLALLLAALLAWQHGWLPF